MNLQSENINELALALSKAQGSMGFAKTDKIHPHYKSKYADLASVWDACRAPLSENALAVVQGTTPAEGGTWMLVTTLAHSSGQWMRSYMPIITQKSDSQSFGSAVTYTKRYSLAAMVGVSTGEDDDGEAAVGDRKQKSTPFRNPSAPIKSAPAKKDDSAVFHGFIDKLSEKYDKNLILDYIEKRSERFNMTPNETVSLMMKDEDGFVREFESWIAQEKKKQIEVKDAKKE